MEDCVDSVGSAKFVTKIDLLKGYYQVPLTPRAQEVSAFITPSGLYSYNEFRPSKRAGYLPAPDESCGLRAGWMCRLSR